MNHTVDINVNLNGVHAPNLIPGLLALFPGLTAFFSNLEGRLMDKMQELEASTIALAAKVEEGNSKTDQLILVANTMNDELVALKGHAASGIVVTEAAIQALIDKQAGMMASITAQEAQTDAGVALGAAPAVPAVPAPV